MKRLVFGCLLLGGLVIGLSAHAEGGSCPDGYYPIGGGGTMGCAPLPSYRGGNQQQTPRQPPPEQWSDRFGAIATDVPRGAVGVATNQPSRQAAEQSAMVDCRSKGGKSCKLETWYRNGCAAMVVGDGGYNVGSAATLNQASQAGIKICNDAGAPGCRVYYSACSPAVRIQ